MQAKTQLNGSDYANAATEGDHINIPQYDGALRVNHVSEIMLGVEFVDESKRNNTEKSLMINANSGALYLVAGSTDKGRVDTVEVLA